jgi:hypothetical protein
VPEPDDAKRRSNISTVLSWRVAATKLDYYHPIMLYEYSNATRAVPIILNTKPTATPRSP